MLRVSQDKCFVKYKFITEELTVFLTESFLCRLAIFACRAQSYLGTYMIRFAMEGFSRPNSLKFCNKEHFNATHIVAIYELINFQKTPLIYSRWYSNSRPSARSCECIIHMLSESRSVTYHVKV